MLTQNVKLNLAAVVRLALLALTFVLPVTGLVTAKAATYTVDRTDDAVASACSAPSNDCSLRGAVTKANINPGSDTIVFDATVFNSVQTISLASALPNLSEDITINGPGANLLTVQEGGAGGTLTLITVNTEVSATISDLTISKGSYGIYSNNGGTVNATNCTISSHGSYGIYNNNSGTMSLTNCTISSNISGTDGGIYNAHSSTLTATNCTISGNTTGIYNYISSLLTITNCAISGNIYDGIDNDDCTVTATNCTINGNGIDGMNIYNSSSVTTTNCTISGNARRGIYSYASNGDSSSVTATNCTISGNGNGIYRSNGTVTVKDTLVVGNTTNTSGTIIDGGHNIISGSAADAGLEVDGSGDPILADNGGPTKTIKLLSGSPAIDSGGPGGPTTDQRGYPRPSDFIDIDNVTGGDGSDIGAYEVQAPLLTINDVTITEGNSGTTNAVFTVTLSTASSQTVTVDYATANGTTNPATASSDYTATSGTLTFTSGDTSKTISVPIIGDTLDENNETFFVNLSNATNAAIADNQGIGTINDDDAKPAISIADKTVTESTGSNINTLFTVTLSAVSGRTVTVNYATANGTAKQPSDYTTTSGTLTFNAGQTKKYISVPIVGDNLDEDNETFFINLSNATNATIADSQGLGTINDDDVKPTISIADKTVTESTGSNINTLFTVTLSAASGRTVTVNYATANGTAKQPSDYTITSGTLTFAPGQTTKYINVPIISDSLDEDNETFFINLSNATNATIAGAPSGSNQGLGTINDDDVKPTISINDVSLTEGNSGTKNFTFTVSLSAPSGRVIKVDYATADGTATAGSDYVAKNGTLTFSAGQTSKTVSITINGDTTVEYDERFYVGLSNAINASISRVRGVGTIQNDDSSG